LLLLPRLLLHPAGRGGESGRKILQGRIRKFDAGNWSELLESSRRSAQGSNRRTSIERSAEEKQEAMCRAVTALVEQGELSHAARVLKSAGLAPGSPETLAQLRDPNLRPQELRTPLPDGVASFVPLAGLRLDAGLLAAALQGARRGLSPGLGGTRYEHLKVCLDDETSMELLSFVCERLAQGDVPQTIIDAMRMSRLTALRKNNGRVRGVAAGCTFRRLVGKVLAKQFQQDFRSAVAPANFGLCDRSGTDG
jgi:hypothetical protein